MENKPKLLLVVNEPTFFLSHRLNIAIEAAKRKFEVFIATAEESNSQKITALGLNYCSLRLKKWSLNPVDDLKALVSIWQLYCQLKPDIVHHVSIKPVIYGSIAAQLAGVPAVVNAISGLGYIFVTKGTKAAFRRLIVRFLYKLAFFHKNKIIIVQNPDDRIVFLENRLATPQEIYLIRGSGVNTGSFIPHPEANSKPVVLMVARLLREKGIREFVEAAEQLTKTETQAKFVVVGDLPVGNPGAVSAEQLENWEKLGVVEFWGYRRDIKEILQQSHIVCLPSYREGLPKVLVEAAACAKPIVTTDAPGCREIVRDGHNGFLVPVRDSEELAKALDRLINDADLRRSFGLAGRKMVEEEGFSEVEVLDKTFAVYRLLLNKSGRTFAETIP